MTGLTAASCDPADLSKAQHDWTMVVLRQHGKPPIRFLGCALVAVADGMLFVRIWLAKSGGFVLSHSIGDGNGETVARHAKGGQIMADLEGYCRDLEESGLSPADRRTAGRLDIADLMEEVALRSERRRRFRMLAGAALDAFDAWCALCPHYETENRT